MPLVQLCKQTNFELNTLPDGLLAVFTADSNSDFATKQINLLKEKSEQLEGKSLHTIFITNTPGESDFENYYLDSSRELVNQADYLKNKSKLGENLIIFLKEGEQIKYLVHKESPEHEYDWITVISDFADNYANPNPDSKNLYKWGQIVPETGDYLCVDCGYIESFDKGDIFPVCEVCLSGEPAGPTSSDGSYWEKV